MKAAVVEGPGLVRVRELPEPEIGEYEARCEQLFGSVCAGTDTHLVEGHPPFCHWMKPPYILGHESVGRVVEVGAKVRHLKVGDVITRVGCPAVGDVGSGWGGFAQIGVATDWRAMREDGLEGWESKTVEQVLPPECDPAEGTLFITWRETLSYVNRMGIGRGARVLIIGTGGNGLAFASHARNAGAERVVMVGASARRQSALDAGATDFSDYRDENCWAEVGRSEPEGFDFGIDAVGKAGLLQQALLQLKRGGTLGIYGLDDVDSVAVSPMAARGSFTFYNGGYDEAEAHLEVVDHHRSGRLDPSIWQDRTRIFSLDNITEALAAVKDRSLIKPLIRLTS